MIVIDMHLDLAMNALNWNRDLRKTVHEIRQDEVGMTQKGRGGGTVAFPDMRRGDMAVCSATLLARENPYANSRLDFRAPEMAYGFAMGCLAYYRQLEAEGFCRLITDWPSLERHVQQWETQGRDATPLGFVISMEGADPIVSPEQVPHWYDAGLRIVSLVHYGVSRYAHGTGAPSGLTSLDKVIDHVDHVCQLAGSARHAAIGTDLDGGYGIEQSPGDLDTIADLQKIPDLLRARGYAESDVEAIMYGNWLRLFRDVWTGSGPRAG